MLEGYIEVCIVTRILDNFYKAQLKLFYKKPHFFKISNSLQ